MTRNPDLLRTIALIAFLAGGLLLVRAGVLPMWAWNLLTLGAIVARVMTGMDKYAEALSVTELGVTRTHGSRLRKQMTESVSWDELARVEAISREAGPQKTDVLFLLYGSGGSGVAVSAALAQQHDLVGQLRRRLSGFLDDQLAQAIAASERQTFLLWQRA
jgi:hypothetical protein